MDNGSFDCVEEYQTIMDTAPHLIVSINEHGQIIDCNNKISDFLGYNKKDIIGLPVLNFIHPKYHEKSLNDWTGTDSEESLNKAEYKFIRRDGSQMNVIVNSAKIKDENNGHSMRVWVIENNSSQKNKGIKNLKDNLKAEIYLDLISHDIDNLIEAITNYSELLLMKPNLSEQYKKYFQSTLLHTRAISDLISNVKYLLDLGNIFKVKDIDAFKILAEATDHAKQLNPFRILQINQSIFESEVIVRSNEMLKKVFINILNNAVKFDKHDDVIVDIFHSKTKDNKFWRLEFLDHGPGIPDALKEKIFCDFEIGNEYNHGSGLGLAVVKEVVTQSGGRVWVEDRVDDDYTKGSNFVILLPKCN